jgi:hypothetical protein
MTEIFATKMWTTIESRLGNQPVNPPFLVSDRFRSCVCISQRRCQDFVVGKRCNSTIRLRDTEIVKLARITASENMLTKPSKNLLLGMLHGKTYIECAIMRSEVAIKRFRIKQLLQKYSSYVYIRSFKQ